MSGIAARVVSSTPTYNAGEDQPLTQTTAGLLRTAAALDQTTATSLTATHANVSASASAVTLLAANSSRKFGSTIVNDSTAILYIKLGSSASATDYWVAIDGKTTVPGIASLPDGYTGIVTGIWASATGAARVTEMT